MAHRFFAALAISFFVLGVPCVAQFIGLPGTEEHEERRKKQMEQVSNQILMQQLSMLQHNPSLQEQLEITEEQLGEFEPIIQSYRDSQQELATKHRKLGKELQERMKEQDHEGMQELQAEIIKMMSDATTKPMDELKKVLLPHQLNRMKQLGRQQSARMQGGNDDLGIPLALASELGLNREQRRKLRNVTNAERDAYEEATRKLKQEARAKIADALTEEQREKLKELVGDLYDPTKEMMRGQRTQQKEARARREKAMQERAKSESE